MFSFKFFHSGLIVYVVCRREWAREIKCRHQQCKYLFRPQTDSTDVLHSSVCERACICVRVSKCMCICEHAACVYTVCVSAVYMCLSVIELFPTGCPGAQLSAMGLQSGQITPLMNLNRRRRANSWASLPPRSTYYGLLLFFSMKPVLCLTLLSVIQCLQSVCVPSDPYTKRGKQQCW